MMTKQLGLTLALTSLMLASPAHADDKTYDLRKIASAEPGVGVKVKQVEEEKENGVTEQLMDGAVARSQKQNKGKKFTRVFETQEVGKDGKPTKFTLTYESYEDLGSKTKLEVKGLVVQVTKQEDGSYSYAAQGDKAIPPALDAVLANEMKEREKNQQAKALATLLPEKPQKAGDKWKIDPAEVVKGIGFKDPPNAKLSSGSGELKEVVTEGGITYLKLELSVKLAFDTFQGMSCDGPFTFAFKINIKSSVDGITVTSDTQMDATGTLIPPNAPAGMTVRTTVKQTGKEVKTRVK